MKEKVKLIEGTPFHVVEREEGDDYRIVMGNYLASQESFQTVKEAEDYIKEKPWELYFSMVMIVLEQVKNFKKTKK
ncbi:hypothetical protein [Tortoise microvirus 14]|nr:hypothetical protein [Tortoise microvirus 14]